jgi:hypothetical protein
MTIPSDTAERLAKLLGMIGSAHDGEALNAARLADKVVREAGLTWIDILGKPVVTARVAETCAEIFRSGMSLTTSEWRFLEGIHRFRHPSEKQLSWLNDLLSRARAFATAPPPPPRPPPKPRKTRAPGKRPPKPPPPGNDEPAD